MRNYSGPVKKNVEHRIYFDMMTQKLMQKNWNAAFALLGKFAITFVQNPRVGGK